MSTINNKVTASVIAAAVTTLAVYAASLAGVEVPLLVQGALTTILVAAAGYLRWA